MSSTHSVGIRLRRALAAAIVGGLLLLWWGVWTEFVNTQAGQKRQAELRMDAKAEVLSEFARTVLHGLDTTLLEIRSHLSADLQISGELLALHGRWLDGAIVHMSTLDAQGRIVFSTEPITGQNLSDRPMFRSHQEAPELDRLFIGVPRQGLEPGSRRLIHVSRAIFQGDRFAGVVQASVNPVLFETLARGLATREGDMLALTHRQTGLLLVRVPPIPATDPPPVIEGSPFLEPTAPRTGSFKRVSPIDQKPRVYAYRTLDDYPVAAVAGRDEPGPQDWFDQPRLWMFGVATLLSLGFVGLLTVLIRTLDRTDRDRAALAEARQLADASNREKSRFLAMMSHEIRTPLNGVVGMSQLMLGTALSTEQRDYASNIAQSGQAVVAIVNDILDFSRIEAGRLDLRPQPFSMQECIDVVIGMFRFEARSKGLILEAHIDPAVQGNYLGDNLRIRQVLVNLIGNAIKFTERGRVTVRVSHGPSKALCIDVIDTGIGIPEPVRSGLFQRFVQADSSSTRLYGGAGLGLAISKELLVAMGGDIELLDPPKAGGSHFRVTLPLPLTQQLPVSLRINAPGETSRSRSLEQVYTSASPSPESAIKASQEAWVPQSVHPHTSRLPLLLAEDNIVNQKVALIMLSRLGYAVDLAENGRQAVEAAQRKRYGVILMDIRMPQMDGLEATRAIRSGTSRGGLNGQTPIIAVTANALDEDRTLCVQAGMNDFLAKPLLMDHLDRCIRQWLPKDSPPGDIHAAPPGPRTA